MKLATTPFLNEAIFSNVSSIIFLLRCSYILIKKYCMAAPSVWILAVAVLHCAFVVFAGYMMIAPFFPQQLESRNISYLFNTSVFGIFYFTAMLIACFGPRLIKRGCNRIPMIAVGLALFSVSLLSMGLIGSVSSDWLFLALAHLSRLVQGIG